MNGAIFFSGKYGSTAQYADWISGATGLPVFDVKDPSADTSKYNFLILGSSVMFFRLTIRKWVKANLTGIKSKPIILFTVSGAGGGSKLDGWIANSLPKNLISRMKHIALRGRMNPMELSWGLRQIMRIGALINPDPQASKEERRGFDYMDKSSIKPILKLVQQFQLSEASS
ncbi:MAG: flavodoxin domain-containing protein [Bacteroidota bacterium]